MHVVVAGSHGLIGSALVRHLAAHGHHVRRLVRRPVVSPAEISWDPREGRLDPADLAGVDAVVNLGGGQLARPWPARDFHRRAIASRLPPTRLLARAVADAGVPVLVQGSATGFYGDRGDEVLTESSSAGDGFFAELVRRWEAATRPAESAGTRVVLLRTGIVLSRRGGSFGRLLPLIRLGLAGPLGDGRAYWSWISLPDHARAVEHLLASDVAGPVNLTAPDAMPQRDLVAAVAHRVHRPAVLPVPTFALRLAVGPFAEEILASHRVVPEVLLASGFHHQQPDVASMARWVTAPGAPD